MYSHEIEEKLSQQNYILSVKDYFNICDSSPQISQVKYYPFENFFEIQTKDNYCWKFQVELHKTEWKNWQTEKDLI